MGIADLTVFFFVFFSLLYLMIETYRQHSYIIQSLALALSVFRNVSLAINIEVIFNSKVLRLVPEKY